MGKGGGGTETKTICQTVSNDEKIQKCNYLKAVCEKVEGETSI